MKGIQATPSLNAGFLIMQETHSAFQLFPVCKKSSGKMTLETGKLLTLGMDDTVWRWLFQAQDTMDVMMLHFISYLVKGVNQ